MTNQALSLRDLAYNQAKAGDTVIDQAKLAIENIVGFPEDISSEAKAELYEGYQLRFNENQPPKLYAVVSGHYVLATPEHEKNKKVEKVEIGVAFAFSFTSQEFGKLKSTNPALHGVVAQVRSKFADYASNKLGDLKRAAKKLIDEKEGKTTQRQTLDFAQSMTKIFEAQTKSVKVKQSRGDTTANELKFKAAITAFWKAYN